MSKENEGNEEYKRIKYTFYRSQSWVVGGIRFVAGNFYVIKAPMADHLVNKGMAELAPMPEPVSESPKTDDGDGAPQPTGGLPGFMKKKRKKKE